MSRSDVRQQAGPRDEAEQLALVFDLRRAPGFLFRLLDNRTAALFQSLSAGPDITARQFGVLLTLFQSGPMRQTKLGQILAMDRSTLTEMLQRLTERSLVTRRAVAEDRRVSEIRLTAAGKSVLLQTIQSAAAAQNMLLNCLTESEKRSFLSCLNKIAENIDVEVAEPAPVA